MVLLLRELEQFLLNALSSSNHYVISLHKPCMQQKLYSHVLFFGKIISKNFCDNISKYIQTCSKKIMFLASFLSLYGVNKQ